MVRSFLIAVFLTLAAFPALAQEERHVQVRLVPEKAVIAPGETILVAIEQIIEPGWHTYWRNPGDSGEALRMKWDMPKGFEAGEILWPVPYKISYGPLTNYGYEGHITLLQPLKAPLQLPAGLLNFTASIDLLVCQEICIPETTSYSFTLNGEGSAASADIVSTALEAMPLEVGWEATFREKSKIFELEVRPDQAGHFPKAASVEFFPEDWGIIENNAAPKAKVTKNGLVLRQNRGERTLSEVPVLKGVLAYEDAQGQRKGIRFSALNTARSVVASVPSVDTGESDVSFLHAALLALLGGLILNLMPCVFPVLSMKALSLVALKGKEEGHARWHGLAYTAGVLLSFALIAGVMIALKAGGEKIGWGFQLQNPVMTLALGYLFFILGLNLSGFFEFSGRLAGIGQWLTQKHGYIGSFFTGVLATVVATPCTAPFMGAAMGYALTQPTVSAIAVFLALGLGLALPYLLLCLVPALRHHLPHPGAWMETFRQFLAFPMFASAAWLVWVLTQQAAPATVLGALWGMTAIAFMVWLIRRMPARGKRRIAYLLLITVSAVYVISTLYCMPRPASVPAPQISAAEDAVPYSAAKLTELLDGPDPVFVNMTAAWCITCKINEKVALNINSTRLLFAKHGVTLLKGDWTNQDPAITEFLNGYGRQGVPLYIYYGPRDRGVGVRPEPVVLPQILTPGLIEQIVKGETE